MTDANWDTQLKSLESRVNFRILLVALGALTGVLLSIGAIVLAS